MFIVKVIPAKHYQINLANVHLYEWTFCSGIKPVPQKCGVFRLEQIMENTALNEEKIAIRKLAIDIVKNRTASGNVVDVLHEAQEIYQYIITGKIPLPDTAEIKT